MKYKIKKLLLGQQIIDNFDLDMDIELCLDQIMTFTIKFENGKKFRFLSEIKGFEEIK